MKSLVLILAALLALGVYGAHAQTVISNCHDILTTGLNVLDSDIVENASYDTCLAIGYSQVLDCQGHAIDASGTTGSQAMYFPFGYSAYSTVKNCVIKNFDSGIWMETVSLETVDNNTFENILGTALGLDLGDNATITNNRFYYVLGDAISLGANGKDSVFSGNVFDSSVARAIEIASGYASENLFYNNYFANGAASVIIDSPVTNDWNVSYFYGKKVTGGVGVLGGNYYGICSDLNCTGFCDTPVILDGGDIDYLPMSNCPAYPPIPNVLPPVNNQTWDISSAKTCIDNNTLQTVKVIGYLTNNGSQVVNFTSTETCSDRCDVQDNICNPSGNQGLLLFAAGAIAVIIVLYFMAKKVL